MDPPPAQYATTSDGYNIAYSLSGTGRPFVLMPALGFHHVQRYWEIPQHRVLCERLAERFLLLCYDHRGQGMSSRGLPPDLGIAHYELDLVAVTEALEPFILFAPRHTGPIAIKYAVANPSRVAGLVLWNSFASRPSGGGFGSGNIMARSHWDYFLETSARVFAADWSGDPELLMDIFADSTSQADFIKSVDVCGEFNVDGLLGQVRMPTLILATRPPASPYATQDASQHLAAAIHGSLLRLYDDGGAGIYSVEPEIPPGLEAILKFAADLASPLGHPLAPAKIAVALSVREVEVLRLLAAGKSNQQIADALVISLNTVRRHVSNIFAKTGAANRADAVSYAHRSELV